MADNLPAAGLPDDGRPRTGPNGERVSENGHYYWTGRQWLPLDQTFAALPGTGVPREPVYDRTIVLLVALGSAAVLTIGLGLLVFAIPGAVFFGPILIVAAVIGLVVARSPAAKSWALGLIIGSGVAVAISPGAACFGLFFGPSVL